MATILINDKTNDTLDSIKTICNKGRAGNRVSKGEIIAALLPENFDNTFIDGLLVVIDDLKKSCEGKN